jgi:hypothetical protein
VWSHPGGRLHTERQSFSGEPTRRRLTQHGEPPGERLHTERFRGTHPPGAAAEPASCGWADPRWQRSDVLGAENLSRATMSITDARSIPPREPDLPASPANTRWHPLRRRPRSRLGGQAHVLHPPAVRDGTASPPVGPPVSLHAGTSPFRPTDSYLLAPPARPGPGRRAGSRGSHREPAPPDPPTHTRWHPPEGKGPRRRRTLRTIEPSETIGTMRGRVHPTSDGAHAAAPTAHPGRAPNTSRNRQRPWHSPG